MLAQASRTAASTILLLLALGARATAAAESVGMKAKITNAVCSSGVSLNNYSIECVDEYGQAAACGFGRSANMNANGKLVIVIIRRLRWSSRCHHQHQHDHVLLNVRELGSFLFAFVLTVLSLPARQYIPVYISNEIPEDDGDDDEDGGGGGGRYVAVGVRGCLGQHCHKIVDAQHLEICVEDDAEDQGEEEGEDQGEGEGEDQGEGGRKLSSSYGHASKSSYYQASSSAEGYSFLESDGQACGEAGSYDVSVRGFKLDTFGVTDRTWGYGNKNVNLFLTLSSSDQGKSHYSQDADDDEEESYVLGYCEITLRTGRNPPQIAIVAVVTLAVCSLVFYLAFVAEKRKRAARDNKVEDYDSMTDSDDEESVEQGCCFGCVGGSVGQEVVADFS